MRNVFRQSYTGEDKLRFVKQKLGIRLTCGFTIVRFVRVRLVVAEDDYTIPFTIIVRHATGCNHFIKSLTATIREIIQ